MAIIDNIPKNFDYQKREDEIYANWDASGYFHAEVNPNKKPYTIMMPPPNITGQLHMGHALDSTLQDILIRWRRMQGYEALWLPGTDHASIATEAKVVDKLRSEGKAKSDVGREGFLDAAWEWKNEYGNRISKQLRKLGASCDWSRERFTLDEGMSRAVLQVFVNLYNEGLIYRRHRMGNWCPNCLTNISDIEVEYVNQNSNLWHLAYPLADGSGNVEIATTRPETMLGDTAVAVNPNDDRYKTLVGKTVILPIVGREIPIIADDYVSIDFGTGQVKITPAHDPNDFAMGQRHDLEFIEVMDAHGNMNDLAGEYAGLSREQCRKKIVEDLQTLGDLIKIEPIQHNVGTCSRCGTTIESRASIQWFVNMQELAGPAIDVVRDGSISFVPEHFNKTYFNWMENIQDWSISRQLWWGHRIPAYYCQNEACKHINVAVFRPDACENCASTDLIQDEDTLDTWFSSALWPFSTLGWPEKTLDLDYFYPTNTLVTGYDIIFFWVARMIFSGLKHDGKIPFENVFIHGIVRDEQGRKMSKSLGNGVDPLEVIEKYGTDALRYSLINGTAPGNDQRYQEQQVEAGRAFVNKIWNAFRFTMMNMDEGKAFDDYLIDWDNLQLEDSWILSRLNTVIAEVTRNLENFELGVALSSIYGFLWDEFCDWYIEMIKPRLFDKEHATRETAQAVLLNVLQSAMTLLHPFMPFVSEEIYGYLHAGNKDLMVSTWPKVDENLISDTAESNMSILFDVIRQVRNLRAENEVKPKKEIRATVISEDTKIRAYFETAAAYLKRLAGIAELSLALEDDYVDGDYFTIVFTGGKVLVPAEDISDPEKEKERLLEEAEKLRAELAHSEKVLANENFVKRAPEAVVNKERSKLASVSEKLDTIEKRLEELNCK